MKKSKTSETKLYKKTSKKLGRHRKYRGKDFKEYKGQGR